MDPRAEKAVFDFILALDDPQGGGFGRERVWVGPAQVKALAVGHVKAHQGGQLGLGFNAFGDDARVGEGGELLHAADQGLAHQILVHPAHQSHIQLDKVRLHVGNEVEAGIARPGVVNADLVVLRFVMFNNAQKIPQIGHGFTFGDLKNDVFGADGKARQIFAGEALTEACVLNNVGVDVEKKAQARGQAAGRAQGAVTEKVLQLQHASMAQGRRNKRVRLFQKAARRAPAKGLVAENRSIA